MHRLYSVHPKSHLQIGDVREARRPISQSRHVCSERHHDSGPQPAINEDHEILSSSLVYTDPFYKPLSNARGNKKQEERNKKMKSATSPSSGSTEMDSKQLMDSLTAHVALYHSSLPRPSKPLSNPRNSILRWFSSLSIPHRQSSLTINDHDFVQILLQMLAQLRSRGHGFFLVLPDLPSTNSPSLPSLCFRRSRGLLSRASAANDSELSLSSSIRVFSSREGDAASLVEPLDTITVAEDLVGDMDRFVDVMDGVSDGQFLRGDDGCMSGSKWHEMPWLKAKGYYSLEAFVANGLEQALRLSWLSCCTGKKRGAKVKQKLEAAGVAANVFSRKKGCLDWWEGLVPAVRRKVLRYVLGKAAKRLANDAFKNEITLLNVGREKPMKIWPNPSDQSSMKTISGTDMDVCSRVIAASFSGKPVSLAKAINGLLVLQEISAIISACQDHEIEKGKLFFSTLDSLHTISDFLFSRLRGFMMKLSSDYVKHELFLDDNLKLPISKSRGKSGGGSKKGKNKGRNAKKSNSATKSSCPDVSLQKLSKECGAGNEDSKTGFPYLPNDAALETDGKSVVGDGCTLQMDSLKETSSTGIDEVHQKVTVNRMVQTAEKRSRKDRNAEETSLDETAKIGSPEEKTVLSSSSPAALQDELTIPSEMFGPSTVQHLSIDPSVRGRLCCVLPNSSLCNTNGNCTSKDDAKLRKDIQEHSLVVASEDKCHSSPKSCQSLNKMVNGDVPVPDPLDPRNSVGLLLESSPSSAQNNMYNDKKITSCVASSSCESLGSACNVKTLSQPAKDCDGLLADEGIKHQNSGYSNGNVSWPVFHKSDAAFVSADEISLVHKKEANFYVNEPLSSFGGMSFEWPSLAPLYFPSSNSQPLPAATDRLHLDVGQSRRSRAHQSFITTRHHARNVSLEVGHNRTMPSQPPPMSLDWPPMVRSASRFVPSLACNYDSGLVPRLQSPFRAGFTPHGVHLNGMKDEDERKYPGDVMDFPDLKNSDLADDTENHWVADDEYEPHAFSGRDYNQFFGGGVMYWNTVDQAGTGFSRPPSLSSEDSSWAWHEAELNRTIDDMVGLPTYGSGGLASPPPAGPFCSPFDPLGPGHQPLGYVIPGNDAAGKVLHSSSTVAELPEEKVCGPLTNSPSVVEGLTADTLTYPILPPIIVPTISRNGSGSEFKVSHDHKSPCVPPSRRETPRIKRPPSPVVLCVPRAPRAPPPSPIGESRKQRGFPTVRSGSSSPRHWGMRSWYHDGTHCEDTRLCVDGAEVVWPSWGNKGLASGPMIKPLRGSLLQDRLIAISQLTLDQEHVNEMSKLQPDVALPMRPPDSLNCPARKISLSVIHSLLHEEIDSFCKQVAAGNLVKKPYINWAVKRVARSLQVLWPRSRTNIFGSNATGLALPTSDVDLVVCLPPVRNLVRMILVAFCGSHLKLICLKAYIWRLWQEPIKEAGILEGRNGIKETCLQVFGQSPGDIGYRIGEDRMNVEIISSKRGDNGNHKVNEDKIARYLANQEWVKNDSLKTIENTAIPVIMLVAEVPDDAIASIETTVLHGSEVESAPMSVEQSNDNNLQMVVSENTSLPLCLGKENDDSMDVKSVRLDISFKSPSHTGLQTSELVRELTEQFPAAVPLALVLKQFLADRSLDHSYSGGLSSYCLVLLITRFLQHEHHLGRSINQVMIELFEKLSLGSLLMDFLYFFGWAFADAYSILENELINLPGSGDQTTKPSLRLLPKIIPSIGNLTGFDLAKISALRYVVTTEIFLSSTETFGLLYFAEV
ncbi:hypothetical protein ACLOJK_033342 [Asimina triloba]